MAEIILLFSATDDISSSLFVLNFRSLFILTLNRILTQGGWVQMAHHKTM